MADSDKLEKGVRKFDGTKYSSWKFRILSLLSELDIDHVITTEQVRPVTPERIKAEKRAKGVIVKSLEDSLLGFAKGDVTAKGILDSLNEVYERKSVATQLALRKSLLELRLEGDTPLIKHFTVFDDMISELLTAGAAVSESDKITHLFLTLPRSYTPAVTAFETLSSDELNLPFVKIRLLDQELKLKKDSADTALKALMSKVLIAEGKSTNGTEKMDTTEQPNQQNHNSNNSQRFKKFKGRKKFGRNNVKCNYCKKRGHIKKDCFKLKNKQRNNGNNSNNGNNNSAITTATTVAITTMATTVATTTTGETSTLLVKRKTPLCKCRWLLNLPVLVLWPETTRLRMQRAVKLLLSWILGLLITSPIEVTLLIISPHWKRRTRFKLQRRKSAYRRQNEAN